MTSSIKVTGVSLNATEKDLREFFSFSGDIEKVFLSPDGSGLQTGFVVFKSPKALDTALLLTGAKIVDAAVMITAASADEFSDGHGGPSSSLDEADGTKGSTSGLFSTQTAEQGLNRAQKVISNMLAKGYTLGKDAMGKAKTFDEKHNISGSAAAKAEAIDKKLGLSERLHAGAQGINQQLREVDEKYHVSEKTRGFFTTAEDKVNEMGAAVINNRAIQTTSSWFKDTFEKVVLRAMDKANATGGKNEDGDDTSAGERLLSAEGSATSVESGIAGLHFGRGMEGEAGGKESEMRDIASTGIIKTDTK